jgi:arylamine N-acetyltransferase
MSIQNTPADLGGRQAGREDAIDLPTYLARTGYTGPLRPTPDVLGELIERHMATIPFEAVDVMLDRGIDLGPASIDRKLLAGRRGGYCFEHQSLLRRALVAIGFPVERLLARVRVRETPDGSAPPATHASLKVEAGGRFWLADVGFGGFMPNVPLAWEVGTAQETRFGIFRIRDTDDGQLVETRNDDGWSPLYEILRFRWHSIDFEVANHYVVHHPSALFRTILIAARTEVETRYTLLGNRLTIHSAGGSREERLLDADGIETALGTIFGLPVEPEWRPLIERAAALPG